MNREMASQWLDSKNSPMKLEAISPGSRRTVWWKSSKCGHEWRATTAERERVNVCGAPGAAPSWTRSPTTSPSSGRNGPPTTRYPPGRYDPPGRPPSPPSGCAATARTTLGPHRLPPVRSGRGAPSAASPASSASSSTTTLARTGIFGGASSGRPVEQEAFVRRARWLVDITTQIAAGVLVAIEYVGSYWHADKADIDIAKSLDLRCRLLGRAVARASAASAGHQRPALCRVRRARNRTRPRWPHRERS